MSDTPPDPAPCNPLYSRARLIAAGTALTVAALGTWWTSTNGPLTDEWTCSNGEVPVVLDAGGQACISAAAAPGDDEFVHPLGNRPESCENRKGWTELVTPYGHDCLREGAPAPTATEWDALYEFLGDAGKREPWGPRTDSPTQ